MDKSIVAMEESHHRRSDCLASASKSLGSLVQINSIAIDISCAMEEIESPVHEHFSIRGFVAGMRKKDWKICLPFASENGDDDDDDDLVGYLPPLSVPRFRWWQCTNCVPDITSESTRLEMLLPDTNDVAGKSSFPNIDGERDGLFLHRKQNIDSKEKTDFRDDEGGNRCLYITDQANSFQIRDGHNSTAGPSDMVCVVDHPHIIVDEPENASSGSDDAFSALPHRRKQKLRSLADIMEEEKNSMTEHPRMKSVASSSGMQVITSTETEADLDPPRKRKVGPEEDRGAVGTTTYPTLVAKISKGPCPDAEKTCKRVEICDSEREGVALLSAKTQQIKPKKNKALDISRKTRRQSNIGNTGDVRLALEGETGQYFRSFPSGQVMDRISNLSKCKKPEVEADHSSLMAPSKKILGDCNILGKVALDLSLNEASFGQLRGIPDLNESFTEKTSITQGKQLSTLSETSLTLHKTSDMSVSCSKETAREGKRQFGHSESRAIQSIDSNLERDDIPMDIVELLAKNQRERTLGNARKQHLLSEGINNSIKGSSAVYVDERPTNGMVNFPFTNTTSKTGVGQGILSFPQSKNCQLFSSFPPHQQRKTQYSSSNSVMPGPKPTDASDLLWPPRRKNVPFHLNINQNGGPVQPNNGLSVNSFSDQCYKGIEKKALRGVKDGRIGSRPKSVGSTLDAYSNDTIPAMQLLSLMDRGIVSGSSFKVGSNNFLDNKPFSPCNHHPRLNQNDRFLRTSLFSQSSHTNNFPGLFNGVCFSNETLKKSYGRGQKPPESLDICTLNRNPADFTIPDARNEFTITAKDLKFRKRNTLRQRSHIEGHKRQRVRKDT